MSDRWRSPSAPGAPRPEPAVRVFSLDLSWPAVAVTSERFDAAAPGVASVAIAPPQINVQSFFIAGEPRPDSISPPNILPKPPSSEPAKERCLSRTCTMIRPPADVVRLADRLAMVLEPPLECLLGQRSLEFPAEPFAYQLAGVAFLYPRASAVLADEMGLGKTMQAITAIRLLLHAGRVASVLLVCPKPLVTNWQREFARWSPELRVLSIEGDRPRRAWQWRLGDVPVKLANYEALLRDRDVLDEERIEFDLVVLDESQRIKNARSATAEATRAIRRRRSWALTGTPIENSTDDLVGIFDFVAPGHLSSQMKPRQLGRVAADYVLRRTKDRVLKDLPPRLERDAVVELTPEQRESYRLAEHDGVLRLSEMGEAVTIQHVFELVLRLKQICNFDPATGDSAKLERLLADVEEIAASGKKAIVFSQWVHTLSRLAGSLAEYHPLEFHGRIPPAERERVLTRFRDDPRHTILLLSYGAGGVGLNLQCAGYVFLFDRWWNPAVEDQAINRAHRIGSSGPVTVTRFLTSATIEERIDRVLAEKRELFDTVFSHTRGPSRLGMTEQEIFGLFQLKCPHEARRRSA